MSGWTLQILLLEVGANFRAHLLRNIVVAVVMVGGFTGVVAIEATTTQQRIDDSNRLAAAGKYVYVVTSPLPSDEPQIPRASCDQLGSLPQIVASGGLLELGFHELSGAPGTPLHLVGGTGRLARVLDPDLTTASGGWVSFGAATQTGIGPNEAVMFRGRTINLRAFRPERRFPSGESLLVVPYYGSEVDSCWFETTPQGFSAATQIAAAAFAGTPIAVGSRLEDDPTRVDPAADFSARPSRHLWVVIGGAVGITLTTLTILSRAEIALYRSLGVGRPGGVILFTFSYALLAIWALLAAILGTGLVAGTPTLDLASLLVGARSGMASASVALALLVCGVLLAHLGSIAQALKLRT